MSDVDEAINVALGRIIGTDVFYFSACNYNCDTKQSYWAVLTRDSIILLHMSFSTSIKPAQISYDDFSNVNCYNYGYDSIEIMARQAIVLSIHNGYSWCEQLRALYTTYHMVYHCRYKTLAVANRPAVAPQYCSLYAPWENHYDCQIGGYLLFMHQDFKEYSKTYQAGHTRLFRHTTGSRLFISIDKATYRTQEHSNLDDYINKLVQLYRLRTLSFILLEQKSVIKRVNMYQDTSQWSARLLIAQNSCGWIIGIIAMRAYIPPLFLPTHFINLTLMVPYEVMKDRDSRLNRFTYDIRTIYDSISQPTVLDGPYSFLVESISDTLSYEIETARFISLARNKPPFVNKLCTQLLRLLLYDAAVIQENLPVSPYVTAVANKVDYTSNMVFSELMWKIEGEQPLDAVVIILDSYFIGFTEQIVMGLHSESVETSHSHQAIANLFKRRLAEYLQCVINNACMSEIAMNISTLLSLTKNASSQYVIATLDIIKFILHYRSSDYSVPYSKSWQISRLFNPASLYDSQNHYNARAISEIAAIKTLRRLIAMETTYLQSAELKADPIEIGNYESTLLRLGNLTVGKASTAVTKFDLENVLTFIMDNENNTTQLHAIGKAFSKSLSRELNKFSESDKLIPANLAIIRRLTQANIYYNVFSTYIVALLVNLYKLSRKRNEDILKYVCKLLANGSVRNKLYQSDIVSVVLDTLHAMVLNFRTTDSDQAATLCFIIGRLSSVDGSWNLFTQRLPILDHVLFVFDAIDITSNAEALGKILRALVLILSQDRRLTLRVGKHCAMNILLYMLQTESEYLFQNCCGLLQELSDDTRIIREISSTDILTTIKDRVALVWKSKPALIQTFEEIVRCYEY